MLNKTIATIPPQQTAQGPNQEPCNNTAQGPNQEPYARTKLGQCGSNLSVELGDGDLPGRHPPPHSSRLVKQWRGQWAGGCWLLQLLKEMHLQGGGPNRNKRPCAVCTTEMHTLKKCTH